ncbi:hypothetical protein LuPra_05884 [Luteitalea pratensis]|uniref:Uncharacterized protein n=1 Tax=Luteitalea pratensis TaxID=1855912 RepID=A0A143PV90_LUTPR|nr:hypothetical protein [Luteitalea pratensis]AMY12605.1 hypothetical protein LuPra_05884 [Luteitalea pratensis]
MQREARLRDLRTPQARHNAKGEEVRGLASKLSRETDSDIESSYRETIKTLKAERDQLAREIADLEASRRRKAGGPPDERSAGGGRSSSGFEPGRRGPEDRSRRA